MAGLWHLSHHQMRDMNGKIHAGAKAFFYAADTLTPITVYSDYGLGTPLSNPVEANAYGVFPPVFLDEDDGFFRQRITTASGVVIAGTDVGTLPIIGPSGGGGGSEVPVEATALFQTGDPIWIPVIGTRAGWVRMNGRTVGDASSGASERAAADCQALFLYLWNNFPDGFCPVLGGRGATAAADWEAHKRITTFDMRGRGPFGIDDMGNAAAGRVTSATANNGGTTAGSSGGAERHMIVIGEMPTHDHGGTTLDDTPDHVHSGATGNDTPDHAHAYNETIPGIVNGAGPGSGQFIAGQGVSNTAGASARHTHPFTSGGASARHRHPIGAQGNGNPHNNMPPFALGTWYQKL